MMAVTKQQGSGPTVPGLPHVGTFLPADVASKLNGKGRKLIDTDWHIEQLYADVMPELTTAKANFHRYVIDANRDPSGQSLYPGANTTTLVPVTDFDGLPIWDVPPIEADIRHRCATYHRPYHRALKAELERVRERHGIAILYDCHSIRSCIPFLFEGSLPGFNIGTNLGTSCHSRIETVTREICENAKAYSVVTNGRFKGGTTRHYGQPAGGIHAIQMELAQSTYLQDEADPWAYDATKAEQLRPHLISILTTLAELAPSVRGSQ